jgi:uncharacterized protein YcbK (DUF882 family)
MALALVFVSSAPSLALAQPDSEDSGDESSGPGAESPASSSGAQRRDSGKQSRRRKSKVTGYAVPDSQLRTTPLSLPSGHLQLYGLASKEEADLEIFNDDGSFDVDELHQADHMLRCKRTDTEKPIDPRLIVILSHVYDHFQKRLEIVSGYRNQRKQTSFHFKGSASDIRIDGVPPKKIVQFASTLDAGGMGIGLYPRARFVHIDVRPLPSYRWIDNARPNPNSPDKRPPRGWKRKKLQS